MSLFCSLYPLGPKANGGPSVPLGVSAFLIDLII